MNNPSTPSRLARGVRSALLGCILGLAAVMFWKYLTGPAGPRELVGQRPVEFPTTGTWLNTDAPLKFAELRGKVVFVQFSFLNCFFCRKMDPALEKWHEQFGPEGLVVIEVDDGSTDSLAEVKSWAAKNKVSYPVYHDERGKMTAEYGITGFPSMFLIGRDGTVLWQGGGWGGEQGLAGIEKMLRVALQQ